jgi:DNA repair exonuclease SbcCD ATPase subunit
MIIKTLTLKNFRSHADSVLDFEQVTILLGPTGTGKTSVIDSIAYALVGANQFTAKDGKNAQNLIRLGAENEKITVALLTDKADVTRTRTPKSVSLAVSGSNAATVPQNQAIIFERLGIGADALIALLDAKPLLSRTPADQHAILCRLLPPPEINLSQKLVSAGVPKPMGVEHLDKIIKEWKTEKLRDLNRERKQVEAAMNAPKWPLEGYTEEDVAANMAAVMRDRDRLTGDKAILDTLITKDEKTLAEPKQPVAEADPAKIKALQKQVESARAKLAEWQADSKERCEAIDRMGAEVIQKRESLGELVHQIEALEKFPHCETCTCSGAVDAGAKLTVAHLEHKTINEQIVELQRRIKAHTDTDVAATTAITKAQAELRTAELDLRAAEATQKATKATKEPREATERRLNESRERQAKMLTDLEALDARLAKGKSFQDQIVKYKTELGACQQAGKRFMDLTREQIPVTESIIDELERLRETLLRDHVGGFLADMQKTLDTFQMPGLAYDTEKGFFFNALDANYLSTGQAHMLFEVAFRIAAANRTGLKLVVLDHVAPVDDEHKAKITEALLGSGCQVLMTWTMSEKPKNPAPAGVRRYWCELTAGSTVLSVV